MFERLASRWNAARAQRPAARQVPFFTFSDAVIGSAFVISIALICSDAPPFNLTAFQRRTTWAVACALPFFLTVSVATALLATRDRMRFGLLIPGDMTSGGEWGSYSAIALATWDYERERFLRSLDRMRSSAGLFGLIPTIFLVLCILGFTGNRVSGAWPFAVSIGAATIAGFLWLFARIMVRVAGQDFNARMFAWASRVMLAIIIADAGLCLLLVHLDVKWVATTEGAVLLGIVTALLGDRAIEPLLDKAAAVFGISVAKAAASPGLASLDGITEEDVERFAEERVLSIHDLAFAPTARLFFNTTHSLQRLCDWQDQALLRVYVGDTRAKALFDQLGVRGAIDLQGFARLIAPALLDSRGRPVATSTSDFEVSTELPLGELALTSAALGAVPPPPAQLATTTSPTTASPTTAAPPSAPPLAGITPVPAATPPPSPSPPAPTTSPAATAALPAVPAGASVASNPVLGPAAETFGRTNRVSPPGALEKALARALGVDGAALRAMLYTVRDDEVTLRLRVHWYSAAQAVND